jgi:hypothetical protein
MPQLIDVSDWCCRDVADWIDQLFEQFKYGGKFASNHIDGSMLTVLTLELIDGDIGINNREHSAVIFNCIHAHLTCKRLKNLDFEKLRDSISALHVQCRHLGNDVNSLIDRTFVSRSAVLGDQPTSSANSPTRDFGGTETTRPALSNPPPQSSTEFVQHLTADSAPVIHSPVAQDLSASRTAVARPQHAGVATHFVSLGIWAPRVRQVPHRPRRAHTCLCDDEGEWGEACDGERDRDSG